MKNQENTSQNNANWEKAVKAYKDSIKVNNKPLEIDKREKRRREGAITAVEDEEKRLTDANKRNKAKTPNTK